MRIISPTCPRCNQNYTYDIIPEIPNIPEVQLTERNREEQSFITGYIYEYDEDVLTKRSIGNAKYYCMNCGHTWKKYRGKKPYERIRTIFANAGGYPGPYFEVKIDLVNALIEQKQEEMLGHLGIFNPELLLNPPIEEEIGWFREELHKCDFVNWAEEYMNLLPILDGGHWSVRIEYDTYCEIKYGSNHYPKKWSKFCKAVSRISRGEFY